MASTPQTPGPEAFGLSEPGWARGIIEAADDGIITIDARGGILYMNPAAQRMFGYTLAESEGRNVSMLMNAGDAAAHDQHLDNYLETGERKIIGIGRDLNGRRKDGHVFPMHLTVSEAKVDGLRLFTAIVHDITPEHQALEEQRRLLGELTDRNKKITCLYSVGEVIRSTEFETDLFEGVCTLVQPACHNPDQARVRITFDDRCYAEFPFENTPWHFEAPINVAGRVRGQIEVFYLEQPENPDAARYAEEDLSLVQSVARTLGNTVARREAWGHVLQASKLASVGELAAGVGHEINNPTNGIINCADLLLERLGDDEKNLNFVRLIRSEAERIATIVKNLLTFSRQDQEQHSLARLCDIVEGVLSLSGKKLARSHIRLEVDVPEWLPKIKCRSEQIQQVLMNLIINAIHALDEKYPGADPGKALSLRAEPTTIDGVEYLALRVRDTGIGVSKSMLDRLFDPFFTTKGRDRGTGLGLSVSDGIIKDHGGQISVESTVGEYTEFSIELPLDNAWTIMPPDEE